MCPSVAARRESRLTRRRGAGGGGARLSRERSSPNATAECCGSRQFLAPGRASISRFGSSPRVDRPARIRGHRCGVTRPATPPALSDRVLGPGCGGYRIYAGPGVGGGCARTTPRQVDGPGHRRRPRGRGVRANDGLMISSSRAASITASQWLRHPGYAEAAAWPANGSNSSGLRCNALGCIYRTR
jgi:hypothetical protein